MRVKPFLCPLEVRCFFSQANEKAQREGQGTKSCSCDVSWRAQVPSIPDHPSNGEATTPISEFLCLTLAALGGHNLMISILSMGTMVVMPRFGQRLPPPCAYPLSQDIWSLDRKWPSLRSSSIPTDPRDNPPEVINWNTTWEICWPLNFNSQGSIIFASHNLDPKNSGTIKISGQLGESQRLQSSRAGTHDAQLPVIRCGMELRSWIEI